MATERNRIFVVVEAYGSAYELAPGDSTDELIQYPLMADYAIDTTGGGAVDFGQLDSDARIMLATVLASLDELDNAATTADLK